MYDRPANLFVAGFIGSPPMNMVKVDLVQADGGAAVAFAGIRLAMPDSVMDARPGLKDWIGKEVVIGIRPEDLEDPEYVANPIPGARLPITVDVREAMGSEVFVHFTVDAPRVVTEDTRDLADDAGLPVEDVDGSARTRGVHSSHGSTRTPRGRGAANRAARRHPRAARLRPRFRPGDR